MNLDDLFEQKNDVAKAVLEELEKVIYRPIFTVGDWLDIIDSAHT